MSDLQANNPVQTHVGVNQSIWRNQTFLVLFFSSTFIALGMRVYELALPLILYNLTHSAVVMGTMKSVEYLPNVLLAIFIGVYVDRVRKKPYMQLTTFLQVIMLIGFFVMIKLNHVNTLVFYLIGFTLMVFNYTYGNLRGNVIKNAIPKSLLTEANASLTFVQTLLMLLGPALTGMILMLTDLNIGLLLTALALAVGLLIAFFMQIEEPPMRKRDTFWNDLKEGWMILRANRPLWYLSILVIFLNCADGSVSAMIVFYAKDSLKLSSMEVGIVLSVLGVGGMLGASIIARVRKKLQIGSLLGLTIPLVGISYISMFVAKNVWVFGTILFIEGVFSMMQSICISTYRQETTPAEVLGRVSGLTGTIFKLGLPFAIYGSGWLADTWNASSVFLAAGCLDFILFAAYWKLSMWKLK